MEELLPAKDVKALFVSELLKGGKLIRKEVHIKNGDKVSTVGLRGFSARSSSELAHPFLPAHRKPRVRETLRRPQATVKSRTSRRWSPPGSFAPEGWIPMLTPTLAKVRKGSLVELQVPEAPGGSLQLLLPCR